MRKLIEEEANSYPECLTDMQEAEININSNRNETTATEGNYPTPPAYGVYIELDDAKVLLVKKEILHELEFLSLRECTRSYYQLPEVHSKSFNLIIYYLEHRHFPGETPQIPSPLPPVALSTWVEILDLLYLTINAQLPTTVKEFLENRLQKEVVVSNAIRIYDLVRENSILGEYCLEQFIFPCTPQAFLSPYFPKTSKSTLIYLISTKRLLLPLPQLWGFILRWMDFQLETSNIVFDDILGEFIQIVGIQELSQQEIIALFYTRVHTSKSTFAPFFAQKNLHLVMHNQLKRTLQGELQFNKQDINELKHEIHRVKLEGEGLTQEFQVYKGKIRENYAKFCANQEIKYLENARRQIGQFSQDIQKLKKFGKEHKYTLTRIVKCQEMHLDFFSKNIHQKVSITMLKDTGFKVVHYSTFLDELTPKLLFHIKESNPLDSVICIGVCHNNSNILKVAAFGQLSQAIGVTNSHTQAYCSRAVYWYLYIYIYILGILYKRKPLDLHLVRI